MYYNLNFISREKNFFFQLYSTLKEFFPVQIGICRCYCGPRNKRIHIADIHENFSKSYTRPTQYLHIHTAIFDDFFFEVKNIVSRMFVIPVKKIVLSSIDIVFGAQKVGSGSGPTYFSFSNVLKKTLFTTLWQSKGSRKSTQFHLKIVRCL